jgi:hypothetical protein
MERCPFRPNDSGNVVCFSAEKAAIFAAAIDSDPNDRDSCNADKKEMTTGFKGDRLSAQKAELQFRVKKITFVIFILVILRKMCS